MLLIAVLWLGLGTALYSALRRLVRPTARATPLAFVGVAAHGSRPTQPRARDDARAQLRARGAVGGAVAGSLVGLLLGGVSFRLILLSIVTGILVGVLVGESAGGGPIADTRGASLRRRRLSDYAGWQWIAVPVTGLIADVVVVGIGLRPHVTGPASATCDDVTWTAYLRWPSRPVLCAALLASVLLAALLGLVLRQTVRRRQTVRDADEVAEDDALRALTARQAIALTFAGQLLILAGVAWSIGSGYVTPCQNGPAVSAGAVSVLAFLGAIASLFVAGSRAFTSDGR